MREGASGGPDRHRTARRHGTPSRRSDALLPTLGAETPGTFATDRGPASRTDAAGTETADTDASGTGTLQAEHALDALERAVAAVRSKPVDELDDHDLNQELRTVERACRQLSARQARLAAARSSRAARRARDAARSAGRAEDAAAGQATRQVRRELADDLGWSPSQAKQAVELGGRLDPGRNAGRAFDAGQLPTRHAAVLADTLRWINGVERRKEAEAELLPLAATQDAVAFGRSCRRLLAEFDPAGAEDAAVRRQGRRKGAVSQTEDGMTAVSSRLAGLDAELFTTAFHAFRRPNAPDEQRSSEQAGADALVAMARAALDAGTAPASRRVRPHVTVTIDWQTVLRDAGVPEGAWTGPLPVHEIRRLLADCGVSRLLTDPNGAALEAGQAVRDVPVGLTRALEVRDGGCIADGCDMQARWCQVMHLEVPYRLQGRLTLDTAALGCSYHHDKLDRRGWTVTWIDGRPILHHPDRPPSGRATAANGRGRSQVNGQDATSNAPRVEGRANGDGRASPSDDRASPGGDRASPRGDRASPRDGSDTEPPDGERTGSTGGGSSGRRARRSPGDPPAASPAGTPPATPLRLLDDT